VLHRVPITVALVALIFVSAVATNQAATILPNSWTWATNWRWVVLIAILTTFLVVLLEEMLARLTKKSNGWEKQTVGEQKDSLWDPTNEDISSIRKQETVDSDKTPPSEIFARYAIGIGVIIAILWWLVIPVTEAHTVLVRANPSMSFTQGWNAAIITRLNGYALSSRGARISDLGTEVTTNSFAEDTDAAFYFTLSSVNPSKTCATPIKNMDPAIESQSMALALSVRVNSHDVSGPPLFSARDFYAVSDAGAVLDDSATACPNRDDIFPLKASQKYDCVVNVRVPAGHGYIGYRWTGEGGPVAWEWRY
jgi:hypothetical protein